ncbi:MAG: sulfatase-like hydrolase/transferase [Candidatus Aminicenantes bacterium]|nr:MAG: sulfatase-like hydrolase/transferase [Candidatus Aminicenantes bacterium]
MSTKKKELPRHPNLLFIMTDQERYTQHFPDGWEENNLPNMQRLKNNGLTFTNAFTCASMCSPSRAAIFTGRYPSQTGVTKTFGVGTRFEPNKYDPTEIELNPEIPNLARMLHKCKVHKRKVYDKIHYRGKWHMSKGPDGVQQLLPQQIDLYGFAGWKPPDGGQDWRVRNIGGGFVDNDTHYTKEAVEFINERGREKEKSENSAKPWCLVFSLINPHDIWTYPRHFPATGYDDDMVIGDIEVPETINEKLKENGKPSAQWQLIHVQEKIEGKSLHNDPQKQINYLNFYGNLMKKADEQIGQVLQALEENGLSESTIIVRTADHGEMGLAHGGLTQKMFNVYEETIHIPLIISNPVLFPERKTTDHLASTIDILPTLAGLLKVEPPEGLPGVDLSPLIREYEYDNGPKDDLNLRTEVLFTFDDFRVEGDRPSAVAAANRIRCVRTKEWKYARYFHADSSYKEEYEMYDLKNDPNELDNVAWPGSPRYEEVREEREKLKLLLADLEEKELPRKKILKPEPKED